MPLPITTPKRMFYSQRIDGRPFVNCLPYSLCPVLRWTGYDVPATYGMELRVASGVPIAEGRGTSFADMRRALGRILPSALEKIPLAEDPETYEEPPLQFEAVTDAQLLNVTLPRAKRPRMGAVVTVVARMELLPRYYRRHVGYSWRGLHALTLYQRRKNPDGSSSVYYSDPMGRTYRGYAGEWIAWADLGKAVKRTDAGLIRTIHGYYGSAR